MCVICYKPKGNNFPSKTKIKTMFKNNPDGAGFMYSNGKDVIIKKGLMTLSEFNAELNKVKKYENQPFVFHFRITTHGGTSRGLCHPFPLSDDIKLLESTNVITNIGIAHNGIIPLTRHAKKTSDTAQFIRQYMTKLLYNGIDADMLDVIEECIQSKMAILENSGNVHLLGNFVQDGNGVYYSNDSYKTKKEKNKTKKTWYNNYNDTFAKCSGECDLCKYEQDCFGYFTQYNPYSYDNYNLPLLNDYI